MVAWCGGHGRGGGGCMAWMRVPKWRVHGADHYDDATNMLFLCLVYACTRNAYPSRIWMRSILIKLTVLFI
jgi:hypothetical protein